MSFSVRVPPGRAGCDHIPAGAGDLRRRLAAIEQAPLFRGATEAEKGRLASLSRERRAGRREFFIHEGHAAVETFVLCSGHVKLTQLSADGHEFIARLAGPGEQFGSLGVLPGGTHSATAEALDESVALAWDRRHVEDVIAESAALHRNALRIVAQRLRNAEEHALELATERVPRRLARVLARLVGQIGRPSEGSVLVALTREELAQMTGTTLFTVSRIFSQWELRGLIRPRREGVLVDDLPGLVQLAGASPAVRSQSAG